MLRQKVVAYFVKWTLTAFDDLVGNIKDTGDFRVI